VQPRVLDLRVCRWARIKMKQRISESVNQVQGDEKMRSGGALSGYLDQATLRRRRCAWWSRLRQRNTRGTQGTRANKGK
jgi:hypothetical protein